jgi:hypothetical protein
MIPRDRDEAYRGYLDCGLSEAEANERRAVCEAILDRGLAEYDRRARAATARLLADGSVEVGDESGSAVEHAGGDGSGAEVGGDALCDVVCDCPHADDGPEYLPHDLVVADAASHRVTPPRGLTGDALHEALLRDELGAADEWGHCPHTERQEVTPLPIRLAPDDRSLRDELGCESSASALSVRQWWRCAWLRPAWRCAIQWRVAQWCVAYVQKATWLGARRPMHPRR